MEGGSADPVAGSVVVCAGGEAVAAAPPDEEALEAVCVGEEVLDPDVAVGARAAVCVAAVGVLEEVGPLSETVPSPFIVIVALPAGNVTVSPPAVIVMLLSLLSVTLLPSDIEYVMPLAGAAPEVAGVPLEELSVEALQAFAAAISASIPALASNRAFNILTVPFLLEFTAQH
ncbi:MAG: hypothetical protein JO122_19500 [Acetobacteraceae bacterium]|nr:hypothetical protein [Acetobacteraceae bacterium]